MLRPMIGSGTIETGLPVAAVLPALLGGLDERSNAVLVAPPGAGKTTLAPLALLDAAWLGSGRIVMLEPRRVAARMAATRMAALLGEAVGEMVGYRTRVGSAVSARTRIEVVTEGLLVARLLGDPTLDGVGAVVFDEVHERTLDGDLALALCLDLQRSRPELRLLAMSATAEAIPLAALMGGAAVHLSEGRAFRSRCAMRRAMSRIRATCRRPSRGRCGHHSLMEMGMFSLSFPGRRRSAVRRRRCATAAPPSCRCTGRWTRTRRRGCCALPQPASGAWCWRRRSRRRR